MDNTVGLVHTDNTTEGIRESISRALSLIKFETTGKVKSVVIKPNLCYYWDSTTGQTTDPRVVSGLVDWIRERYGSDARISVAEADATAMRTKHAFSMLGYRRMAREKSVELLNLSEDSVVGKEAEVNGRTLKFDVPESLLKADLFINVPKLKITTIKNVYVTIALKNMFGCIASRRKIVYHKFLNEAIVGINKVLHPNLCLVDGVFALGRVPTKLGLIMASYNSFSVDWVGSQIMGYDPSNLEYMRLAVKEGLGDPSNVLTCGEKLDTFRRVFPKKNMRFSKLSMTLQMKMLKLYTKMAGDVTHPILEGV